MKQLRINEGADVYTDDGERVGSVDRVVVDPLTKDVSHIVVRKGFLFPEDKVIPVQLIATANEQRAVLEPDATVAELPPFIESHYLPLPDDYYQSRGGRIAGPLMFYTPYAFNTPVLPAAIPVARDRNIPERTVALEAGAPVTSTDGDYIGRFEEILMTESGIATYLVLETGRHGHHRKAIPMNWIDAVDDESIRVGVPRRLVNSIPEYEPGEEIP
jgi:uncharacterized protein YrrD